MGHVGPMFGQYGHFRNYAPEKIPYALARYGDEVHRLLRILNTTSRGSRVRCRTYSIADMPSSVGFVNGRSRDIDGAEFPNVSGRGNDRIAGATCGYPRSRVEASVDTNLATDKQAQSVLFGQR
jgi:GST-like protein